MLINKKKCMNWFFAYASIIAVAVLILLIPHVIRLMYFNNYMSGDVPYYYAKNAQDIMEGQTAHEFNAYSYMLAFSGRFVSILTATNFLPFFIGIITTIFFYLFLLERNFGPRLSMLILLLWITSPLYTYCFTISGAYAMIVSLNIIGFYFFMKNNRYSWVSLPIFMLIPLFGAFISFFTIAVIIAYAFHRRQSAGLAIIASSAILIISLSLISQHGLDRFASFEDANFLQDNIAGLGAIIGFNIFTLALSGIGIIKTWKDKKKYFWAYFAASLLLLASVFADPQFKILFNIFISAFAAIGLAALIKMRWEVKLIRNITIFILCIGILFSSFSYIYRISYSGPDIYTANALAFLKANSLKDDVVLSHYENGFWIGYFADRSAAISKKSPSPKERFIQTSELLKTRNEKKAKDALDLFRIKYIFVEPKTLAFMKDDDNKIGLEFLMENSRHFEKIYEMEDIRIWRYDKDISVT